MTRPHPPDVRPLASLAPPPDTMLPNGFAVELAQDVHRSRDGRLMLGGSPPRLLRLSKSAARVLEPGRFTVADAATAALARRLVDIGVALPRPPAQPVRDVTIVIPARDRAGLLHQLLTALCTDPETSGVPALVVDDGSVNGAAVASVTRLHGATLLVHPHNQGPAAARNTGLRHAKTRYVAFCDSDVLPEPGWLRQMLAQFSDPALALAAPRWSASPKISQAGSNGTRTSGRRWTWAGARLRSCRCPRWPTSPARRWWSAGRPSAADSPRNSGSAKTSTCACDCTVPDGEYATCPHPEWAIATAPICVAGSRSEPATGPERRNWPGGTLARCRR